MKLRNKKTGEIKDFKVVIHELNMFNSLAELDKEWEDYKEPKEYWYFDSITGKTHRTEDTDCSFDDRLKEIGNYFESEEEAKKAVEKLKAITRLNKCGFKFEGYADRDRSNGGDIVIYAHVDTPNNNLLEEAQPAMLKDLDLLFGGEE